MTQQRAKPVVPWMGGKRKLAKHILPLIPEHRTYVEAFFGGGAIFYQKEPSHAEVINDINGDLVNLYRVLKYHLEEFVRLFKWALVSREAFLTERDTNPDTLTDIQRAARFYYLVRTCFGGKVTSPSYGYKVEAPPSMNLLRIEEELSAAHLRLARTNIERLDWQDLFRRYDRPGTFFYLDPPYWETAGYGVAFPWEEYLVMAELARSCKGKVLISINDHPDIREVFAGLVIEEVGITYSVGREKTGKRSGELLIRNYTLPE